MRKLTLALISALLVFGETSSASLADNAGYTELDMPRIAKRAQNAVEKICPRLKDSDTCNMEWRELAVEAALVENDFARLGLLVAAAIKSNDNPAVEMIFRRARATFIIVLEEERRLAIKYAATD